MRKSLVYTALLLLIGAGSASAQVGAVQGAKARHPNLAGNPSETVAALREIAAELNAGILRKTTGNNCLGYACDIICERDGRLFDVFGSWDTVATPQWFGAGTRNPRECEFTPVPEPPNEPPAPNLPPAEDPALVELREIRALLTVIAAQQQAQSQAIVDAVAQLKAEIVKGIKVRF